VINGKIYVAGSHGGRTLFVYGPPDTWTRKANLPQAAFAGAQWVINGKLYVYSAGITGFYRYTPSTNTWATLPKPILVHGLPAAGVIGGKFYLAGGDDGFGSIFGARGLRPRRQQVGL
jgi:N-acetylneuraminic acid mutarotase